MRFECMEIANLILTVVSTISAVISAIAAITAKNEVRKLKNAVRGKANSQNCGKISVHSGGNNGGTIVGVNTGEIRK